MPAGAATKMSVSSSKWSETREAAPSSHHSSRPRASTRSAVPESSRHASTSHHDSGRDSHTHGSTERSSRHASTSHHDSGRSSHHPSASRHDSQSHGNSSKSSMVLVRDKSTGKSLLQRALTGASRTRDPTHDSSGHSTIRDHGSHTRDSRDPTQDSSRHSTTRDHGSRTSSSSHPLESTRELSEAQRSRLYFQRIDEANRAPTVIRVVDGRYYLDGERLSMGAVHGFQALARERAEDPQNTENEIIFETDGEQPSSSSERGHSSTRARSQTQAARPRSNAPGFETRLERIEEGMQRNREPATARPTVVVVQQAATQRVYGHDAFCAGYMAAKRGQ